MQANYAGFAQSVVAMRVSSKSVQLPLTWNQAGLARSLVAVVDFFARQTLAGSWHAGLVSVWSHREGPPDAPGRRVSLDRLQPVIDKLDGAADLGLREWHVKEPLDFLRDFRP